MFLGSGLVGFHLSFFAWSFAGQNQANSPQIRRISAGITRVLMVLVTDFFLPINTACRGGRRGGEGKGKGGKGGKVKERRGKEGKRKKKKEEKKGERKERVNNVRCWGHVAVTFSVSGDASTFYMVGLMYMYDAHIRVDREKIKNRRSCMYIVYVAMLPRTSYRSTIYLRIGRTHIYAHVYI